MLGAEKVPSEARLRLATRIAADFLMLIIVDSLRWIFMEAPVHILHRNS